MPNAPSRKHGASGSTTFTSAYCDASSPIPTATGSSSRPLSTSTASAGKYGLAKKYFSNCSAGSRITPLPISATTGRSDFDSRRIGWPVRPATVGRSTGSAA